MKFLKKVFTAVLTTALLAGVFTLPAMAATDGTVVVAFVYPASGYSDYVRVQSGGTPDIPDAPYVEGYTFCGFDTSVVGVTTDIHTYAVYVANHEGDAAIQAKINSLPVPAISATKAVDRKAMLIAPAPDAAALQAAQAAQLQAAQAAQLQAAQAAQLQAAQAAQISAAQPAATLQPAPAPVPTVLDQATINTLVQNRLNQLGFNCGVADGVFGRASQTAMKQYQQSVGLPADGLINTPTLAAMGF